MLDFTDEQKERVLALCLLLLGIFFFVEAQEFSTASRIFPQGASAIVIMGSILVLVKDYLPAVLQNMVEDNSSLGGDVTEEVDSEYVEEDVSEVELDTNVRKNIFSIHDSLFTGILISAYIVAGLLVSFVVATPIFAVVYGLTYRMAIWKIVLITIICLLLPFGFIELMNAPFDEGMLVGEVL